MERLTTQEMQEVLARAAEIQRQEEAQIEWTNELEQWVHAAEEAGLSRVAVEQALRERVSLLETALEVGDLVFALSTNDRFYVAKVLELQDGIARVEFLSGGECSLTMRDLRPCNLIPGEKVECDWPNWGWWTCSITSYDKALMKVYANDGWGTTKAFHISDIRLRPAETAKPKFWDRFGPSVGTLLAGSLIGAAILWVVMR